MDSRKLCESFLARPRCERTEGIPAKMYLVRDQVMLGWGEFINASFRDDISFNNNHLFFHLRKT